MRRKENEAGVPRRMLMQGQRIAAAVTGAILFFLSVTAGYFTAPEDTRLPVLLASGEVIRQPCYVAVDGECVAVVKNEDTAEKVVDLVKDEYKNKSTVQVEIEENTSIENLDLENGADKPEILTAREASEQIVNKQFITVKTTEVIEEEQSVEYEVIEKESDQLNLGEVQVKQQGQEGLTKVTKEVIKENGIIVSEDILEQETVKESVPEIVISGTAGVAEPLDQMRVTSSFGERWGRHHNGLDLGAPEGTPVYAAKLGTVICAEYKDSFGNLVILDHGEGMETYYAHCSRLDVLPGQQVTAGQQIAAVGSTGNSTGPHLHFEVRIGGTPQDPEQYLNLSAEDPINP